MALESPRPPEDQPFYAIPLRALTNVEPEDNLENWQEMFSTRPVNVHLYQRDLFVQAFKPNDTSNHK